MFTTQDFSDEFADFQPILFGTETPLKKLKTVQIFRRVFREVTKILAG